MTDRAEKAEALIAQMKRDRGYIYPEWEFAARADPEFVEAYNNLYRTALSDGQALDAKTRELVALGILAYRRDTNAVKAHILRAMRLGATQQEILEAIETTIIRGAPPRSLLASTRSCRPWKNSRRQRPRCRGKP